MSTRTPPTRPNGRRSVLIVEDNLFFARCLRSLLEGESDLAVCDVIGTVAEVRERIGGLQPDVLIIDLALGTECGLRLAMWLRANQVLSPIVFVSTLARPSREQLSAVGRSTFVAKSRKPADFLNAVREMLSSSEAATNPEDPEIRIDVTGARR